MVTLDLYAESKKNLKKCKGHIVLLALFDASSHLTILLSNFEVFEARLRCELLLLSV